MRLIAQVGAQLEANLPSFRTITKAWTSVPIADFDAEVPAALYYLRGTDSEASPYNNDTIQPGDYLVGVLVVCAVDDLEDLLAELSSALVGFQPTGGAWEAFEHQSGTVQQINQSVAWWLDVYAVRNYRQ